MTDPAELRRRYARGSFADGDVADTWLEQFRRWFAEAAADPGIVEVNAMQLATADAEGHPAVRTVLVKGIDERGLVFFTNYASAKARDLEATGWAAAVFVWLAHERQIRVSGAVARVSRAETEAYFATRPRESQIGAWASPQSQVVRSRADLDARVTEIEQRFAGQPIPAPPNWGGYRIRPSAVEFWQGRPGRLHDRILFRTEDPADGSPWTRERLAP